MNNKYLYNAAGGKVQKRVTNGANIKTTDYLDGFQYNQQLLEFFPHAEGYVKVTAMNINPNNPEYVFNYVYNYTDHLGNIRLSYTKDPQTGNLKILDESHYYPFGLKHQEYQASSFTTNPIQGVIIAPVTNNPFKYKFQNQELQDELGLNWYSFKWRNYMPDIGRFFNIDPLSQIYSHQSHYNFAENIVVLGKELEGLEVLMPPWVAGVVRPSISIGKPIAIPNSIPQGLNPPVLVSPPYVEARGPEKRTAAPDAEGDHTVFDDRGSTTYKENPNNPNKNEKGKGFETEKRVDWKGDAHKNSQNEKIPTPHVHENGDVRPAIPGQDMPKGILPPSEKTDGGIDAQKRKQKGKGGLPNKNLKDVLKRQEERKEQKQKEQQKAWDEYCKTGNCA
ncbi:MAG: RHS repeat-associated core domain-containing protein [Moheibacter sp.]